MIDDPVQYLMHIAPSLSVALLLVIYISKQMNKVTDRIQAQLEQCMSRLFEHMEQDTRKQGVLPVNEEFLNERSGASQIKNS